MERLKHISGTFLDGLACDVNSQNWGPAEWARQFDVFREMDMDLAVIIRVGWNTLALYKSKVMPAPIYDPDDVVRVFLDQAARVGLRILVGVYDNSEPDNPVNSPAPGTAWNKEIAVNLELIDELLERYGGHPAFHGWYLSHEPDLERRPWQIWNPLIAKMRRLTPEKPILLSPRYEGHKWPGRPRSAPEYAGYFDSVLDRIAGRIDAAAFMDGHVDVAELSQYAAEMKPVLDRHEIEFWSNLETFDREMPTRLRPIDWLRMRHKLESVQPYVSKIITFEAPHFLSPYSMWDSARMLYRRYMEWFRKNENRKTAVAALEMDR